MLRKKLRVMKFGGTSVGDAECIRRVAEIIADAALEGPIVAVISAMSGVTDRLIQAAHRAATGETIVASEISAALRELHCGVLEVLISDPHSHSVLAAEIDHLANETATLCLEAAQRQELTPRLLDAVTSFGERLSTRLVAGVLREMESPGVAVDATELIVTNDLHGKAEPLLNETRERARTRLLPLLNEGAIPVVTGFIGATTRCAVTTLGRSGSDYSATILGAVLDAQEVVLWKDVDGILTADPRIISDARNQPSLSYREATDLALFGAKALHLKTLRPVISAGIPVRVRNSFDSESPGTTITSRGDAQESSVKAVIALSEASAVKALRNTFARQLEPVTRKVAVVAVIGDGIRDLPEIGSRLSLALESEGIKIITFGRGTSESNISVVIEAAAVRRALAALHSEFRLGALTPMPLIGVDLCKTYRQSAISI
jgi:aspartokinase/homoserine dehydrogenase 1